MYFQIPLREFIVRRAKSFGYFCIKMWKSADIMNWLKIKIVDKFNKNAEKVDNGYIKNWDVEFEIYLFT